MTSEFAATVSVLSALASGLFALWTAWYNVRKTDQSFRISLYERRFNLYLEYLTFLQETVRRRQVSHELIDSFERIFDQSSFLFNSSIVDSLRVAFEKSQRLEDVTRSLQNTDADEEMAALCNQQDELNDWFIEEKNSCRARFAQYLSVA